MTYGVDGLTRVSDATSCPCRLRINTDAFTGSLQLQSGSGKFIEGIDGNLTLTDTSQLYGRLVSADPQPGVGYGQLQINSDSPTELRGGLYIHIDSEFVDDIQVGDEFVIMTCSQGCTRFFDDVAVTDPNPSDIYFQVFYQGNQVMIRALDEPPPPEDGIVGLQAVHNGPVFEGQPVAFSAAVSGGSSVFYFWQFGDGATGHGSHVEHSYAAPGVYTATVNAANPASSATFSLPVTIWDRPNFAGQVWHDADGDGRIGPGEMGLAGAAVTAVGPGGSLSDSSDGDGRYRIDTMTGGWYDLDIALSGYQPTTAAPVSLPLPAQGSALLDFGLIVYIKLRRHMLKNGCWHLSQICQKGTQETNRTQLDSVTQPSMDFIQLPDIVHVTIIQMEVFGELRRGRFSRIMTILSDLFRG